METIGEKIKRIRIEKRLSKKEVAEICGLSPSSYLYIEEGKTKSISIEVGKGIARALEVSFTDLFEIEDVYKTKFERLKKNIRTYDQHFDETIELYKDGILSHLIRASSQIVNTYSILMEIAEGEKSKGILLGVIKDFLKAEYINLQNNISDGFFSLKEYKSLIKHLNKIQTEFKVIDLTDNEFLREIDISDVDLQSSP